MGWDLGMVHRCLRTRCAPCATTPSMPPPPPPSPLDRLAPVANIPTPGPTGAHPATAPAALPPTLPSVPPQGPGAAMALPTYFINHGTGPGPLLGLKSQAAVVQSLEELGRALPKCKCLLVVSAHWVEPYAYVASAPRPALLYDYEGYPPEAYAHRYPAPGHPDVAKRVHQLLKSNGVPARLDPARGLDQGVFVPLTFLAPAADVPVVCLSLVTGLDAQSHWRIGRALAPLRDEGVVLLGSGQSYNNQTRSGKDAEMSVQWDRELCAACTGDVARRRARLVAWPKMPFAKSAHPKPDHLMPLLVAAAAADFTNSEGAQIFSAVVNDVHCSGYRFGAPPVEPAEPEAPGPAAVAHEHVCCGAAPEAESSGLL